MRTQTIADIKLALQVALKHYEAFPHDDMPCKGDYFHHNGVTIKIAQIKELKP